MGIFYTHDFPFPSFAAYTLSVIFVFNTIVFVMLAVALAAGSGAYSSFHATPIGIALISQIIMGLCMLHRVLRPAREANKLRSVMTFSALCSTTFITSMVLLIRLPSSPQGSLYTDFSGFPNARVAVHVVTVISCLTTFISFIGLYVVHHELPPIQIMKEVKTAPIVRRPSSTVISLYRQPGTSGPPKSEGPCKASPLNPYDNTHWTTIPV